MGLLRLLCKLHIAIASGYLIGRTLLPENQWLLFLSNIQAYLLLPSVISALILLGRKTGLYFPLALFAFAHAPFSLLSAPEYCLSGKGGELVLRTYTANLAGSVDRGRDFARLAAELELDVMVFQEASPLFLKTEGAALQRELPFAFYLQSEEGYWTQAIFSRYPLAELQTYDPGPGFSAPDARVILSAQVDIRHRKWTILAAHAGIPFVRNRDCRGLHCLIGLYDQRSRDGHLRFMKDLAHGSTDVVLLGDMNLSDQNPIYSGFVDGLIDAGRCPPLQRTWPADHTFPVPFIRIDYTLLRTESPIVVQARTIPVSGSDHLAVLVEVAASESVSEQLPQSVR